MKELISQCNELKDVWKRAYKIALGNPVAWQPHLPNTSLLSLNEAVDTVSMWLSRTRAPSGFSPGFHLAKSLAAVHMPNILTAVQNLEAGQYNHFPSFINALVNLLAAIHTMAVYASKNDKDTINADFTAELSQSLALLNTAQSELSNKIGLLSDAQKTYETIQESQKLSAQIEEELQILKESTISSASDTEEKIASMTELLSNAQANSEEFSVLIKSHASEYTEHLSQRTQEYSGLLEQHSEEYSELVNNAKSLNTKLVKMTDKLEALQEKCKSQEEIIDSILPRGASAGLASAFSSRVSQLNLSKWIWMAAFVGSLLTLSGFALYVTTLNFPSPNEFWVHVASRLPLAAPLIWLGWFSAVQYGNVIRVQEDYAFKEATSKAFQGYKDHMKHLGNVDIDEAQTALKLLSVTTIEILGREPLRIFGNTQHDASPTHSFAKMLKSDKKKKGSVDKVVDVENG